jgi:signal peptidase I
MGLVPTGIASTLGYAAVCAVCLVPLVWVTPVRAAGGSMSPSLISGDVAIVARNRSPEPGDIALLRVPGHGAVLHRVVKRQRDGSLVTRGDANEHADRRAVDSQHAVGSVVAVIPVGRLVQRWRGTRAFDTLTAQPNSARL